MRSKGKGKTLVRMVGPFAFRKLYDFFSYSDMFFSLKFRHPLHSGIGRVLVGRSNNANQTTYREVISD